MADQHVNQSVPNTLANAQATGGGPGVLFVSASRAQAAYNSDLHINPFCRGIRLWITNDAAGGSTATVKLQTRSPKGTFTDIAGAVTAALGSVTGSIFTLYPGITATANIYVDQVLGLHWRAVLTIGVATGTSSVEAEYLW